MLRNSAIKFAVSHRASQRVMPYIGIAGWLGLGLPHDLPCTIAIRAHGDGFVAYIARARVFVPLPVSDDFAVPLAFLACFLFGQPISAAYRFLPLNGHQVHDSGANLAPRHVIRPEPSLAPFLEFSV
ncbi:hypothetical protein [Kerstersia similis]|uniref:hypothetical protein n=1 Tax=Kerstersia similis TaxID=206505 RepID=UPI0039EDF9F8